MFAVLASPARLKHAFTDGVTGNSGGCPSGGTPQAAEYDLIQAFCSSNSSRKCCGERRSRASLTACCRSSAILMSSGSLQMTALDGSVTLLQSKAHADGARSERLSTREMSRIRLSPGPAPALSGAGRVHRAHHTPKVCLLLITGVHHAPKIRVLLRLPLHLIVEPGGPSWPPTDRSR